MEWSNPAVYCPGFDYVEGVAKLADGMVLIHDLETFLSLEEGKALDEAMAEGIEEFRN